MTNTELLKERIDRSGLKLQYIAEQLGLTRFGLYKKLNGESEFRQSEIMKIGELLSLTAEDRDALFFGHKVEKISTEGGEA